jgi:hypothetical protein
MIDSIAGFGAWFPQALVGTFTVRQPDCDWGYPKFWPMDSGSFRVQTMRNLLYIILVLSCAGPTQGQPDVTLFDGKTTSGWVIEGDGEVQDGVLSLGGKQKTWVRVAADFSPNFELHLEYSTENDQHIQVEWHHRDFLGHGMGGMSLGRRSKKPGEWIEAIYWGQEQPAGNWATFSKWRGVGEPAFTEQPLGGSGSLPRTVFVAFEIPVGQKLYLRNVRLKSHPVASFPWLLVFMAGALVVLVFLAVAAWVIMRKRSVATQGNVQPEKGTS